MTLKEFLIKQGYDEKTTMSYIKTGRVIVNSNKETLPNFRIKEEDKIVIKKTNKWVSRGAYKLLDAIIKFNIDFNDKVVLDIGSSTGGFTQVAIEHGAKKVYANDVGTNQLDYRVRAHSQVEAIERTNLKNLKKEMFQEKIDIVVCDVSFISLDRVFDVLENILDPGSILMALIKPQYQAPSALVEEKGFVDIKHHDKIINEVKEYSIKKGFEFLGIDESPIKGKVSKNIEYISLFQRSLQC